MKLTRSLVLAASLVALVVSGCSQPGDLPSPNLEPQFGTPASDSAYGLAKHSTGVYVVGFTTGNLHSTNKGGTDAYIRKVDTSGKLLWGRQFGTNAADYPHDVATDANGNAYVLGSTGGSLARALRGTSDFFLRKYTPSGTVAWTKQMGLETADYPGGVAVSGGFIYVVGLSQDLGTFVYRFDLSGGTSWKKQFSALGYSPGDVTIDGGGNIYVAGDIPVTCDEPESFSNCTDVKLNKYNNSGTLVWSKQVSLAQDDRLEAITAYGSSIYLVEESFDVPDDESYTQLVKLNTSGVAQWIKFLGVSWSYDGYLHSRSDTVSADSSGVYVASTATINYDDPSDPSYDRRAYAATKFAADGSHVWDYGSLDHNYDGTPDERLYGSLNAVVARGGSDVYIAGTVNGGASRGAEAFLKRLNASTGNTVWER